MSWAVGFDERWKRDIGYGVPAYCDHPGCYEEIDRGLGHVCGYGKPYGGEDDEEHGCGLYFCGTHGGGFMCARCLANKRPFKPSADTDEWIEHKMTDPSWGEWRREQGLEGVA